MHFGLYPYKLGDEVGSTHCGTQSNSQQIFKRSELWLDLWLRLHQSTRKYRDAEVTYSLASDPHQVPMQNTVPNVRVAVRTILQCRLL